MRLSKLSIIASLALLMMGVEAYASAPLCSSALTESADSSQRRECEKPWTVLIHMAADNNLSSYAFWDLFELEALGSTKNLDIVVQLDLPGREGVRQYHIRKSDRAYSENWGPNDFRNTNVTELSSRLLRTLNEEVSVSEEKRVREFLSYGMKAFPSKKLMVVVWGHGEGWTAATRARRNRAGGIGMNDTTGRYLSIPALKKALDAATLAARPGRVPDLLVTDACLMQMAEVVTELEDSARYLVGSSQNQDVLGIPYRALLGAMDSGRYTNGSRDGRADEAFLIAQMLPELMREFLERAARAGLVSTGRAEDMGMSAIRLEDWKKKFLPAFQSFSSELLREAESNPEVAIATRLSFSNNLVFENGSSELGVFLRALYVKMQESGYSATTPIMKLNLKLQSALDASVLAYSIGSGASSAMGKRSVSLWVPTNVMAYRERILDYRRSALYQQTSWGLFLDHLFKYQRQ